VQELSDGAWHRVQGPPDPDGHPVQLTDVSCPAVRRCVVVGTEVTDDSDDLSEFAARPWAATWVDGRWSVLQIGVPEGSQVSWLHAVSCAGSGWCELVGGNAVGDFWDSRLVPLTWTFDGHAVHTDPFPDSGDDQDLLSGLDCPTAGTCLAVGSQQQYPQPHDGAQLVVRRDASGWHRIGPGPDDTTASPLLGVSCVDATHCIAGGQQFDVLDNVVALVVSVVGDRVTPIAIPEPPRDRVKGIGGVACTPDGTCLLAGDTEHEHPVLDRITAPD
jgi:hypothetical protein